GEELRRQDPAVRILFLDAATERLVLRYKVERRRHPLSTGSLTDAVEGERAQLAGVRELADLVIDTTELNVHELRDRIVDAFAAPSGERTMLTRVVSFSYKHGVPTDVDLVFDCRFLPNPHWVEGLRDLTGREAAVRDYVLGKDLATRFLDQLRSLFELLLPAYVADGKHYLTVAFGCTGGKHRSVAISEEVARMLGELGVQAQVDHRELGR
ncbi:MAG: RNase adapter RapZ, partial [Acidimicrobiia bacterium]|nr:RNase adapter RapZ [Acidimicrobiia bacterium]